MDMFYFPCNVGGYLISKRPLSLGQNLNMIFLNTWSINAMPPIGVSTSGDPGRILGRGLPHDPAHLPTAQTGEEQPLDVDGVYWDFMTVGPDFPEVFLNGDVLRLNMEWTDTWSRKLVMRGEEGGVIGELPITCSLAAPVYLAIRVYLGPDEVDVINDLMASTWLATRDGPPPRGPAPTHVPIPRPSTHASSLMAVNSGSRKEPGSPPVYGEWVTGAVSRSVPLDIDRELQSLSERLALNMVRGGHTEEDGRRETLPDRTGPGTEPLPWRRRSLLDNGEGDGFFRADSGFVDGIGGANGMGSSRGRGQAGAYQEWSWMDEPGTVSNAHICVQQEEVERFRDEGWCDLDAMDRFQEILTGTVGVSISPPSPRRNDEERERERERAQPLQGLSLQSEHPGGEGRESLGIPGRQSGVGHEWESWTGAPRQPTGLDFQPGGDGDEWSGTGAVEDEREGIWGPHPDDLTPAITGHRAEEERRYMRADFESIRMRGWGERLPPELRRVQTPRSPRPALQPPSAAVAQRMPTQDTPKEQPQPLFPMAHKRRSRTGKAEAESCGTPSAGASQNPHSVTGCGEDCECGWSCMVCMEKAVEMCLYPCGCVCVCQGCFIQYKTKTDTERAQDPRKRMRCIICRANVLGAAKLNYKGLSPNGHPRGKLANQ